MRNHFTSLYEILVPHADDHGIPFPLSHHQEWDRKVRDVAGGLTIMKKARGQWVSGDGRVFQEDMIPVRIACDSDAISEIARMTIDHYGQEAVLYFKVSDMAVILRR